MSRRQPEETSFGSDSFLDIVANIVGILIILIVVAGVRVSQAPLLALKAPVVADIEQSDSSEPSPALAETQPDLTAFNELAAEDLLPAQSTDATSPPSWPLAEQQPAPPPAEEPGDPDFQLPPPAALPPIPDLKLPQTFIAQVDELQKKKQATAQVIEAQTQTLQQSETEKETTARKLLEQQQRLQAAESALVQLQRLLDVLDEENRSSQQRIDQLQTALREIDRQPPNTEQLAHRLNPVGRIVSGSEVHFRLEGGRVSFVPVNQLSLLVKRDMQRRRDFLIKQQRFQTTVGPVSGYEMEYLVQRETGRGSVVDELRMGPGMIRVAVTDWVIRPTGQEETETFEEATAPNSRFRAALVSEGTNATITFWVYPDSYELHRKLKEQVQGAGFWVASRPLPHNFPIAGSASGGSKSIAQ